MNIETHHFRALNLGRGLGRQDVEESSLEDASIQSCKCCCSVAWLQKLDQCDAL